MKDIKTYIQEGFFDNVDASPKETIKRWLNEFMKGKMHFDITTKGLFDHRELFVDEDGFIAFVNPDNGRRLDIDKTAVKIDILKDWGVCWNRIYEESKKGDRVYLVCAKPFIGSSGGRIYIHPYDGCRRVYVYEVNTRTHKAVFSKVMDHEG